MGPETEQPAPILSDVPLSLPDSEAGVLFRRFLPASFLPFVELARLDRPIGWWLLLLPCWWSDALAGMAQSRGPDLGHDALFLIGAIAMRGAGSTFNDLIDRKVDALVERTYLRPLPSGRVSVRAAVLFLLVQCLIGALVLFSLNAFAIKLGLVSLALVAIYPFMKRITHWPQFVLGLAFAWGGLMGWAASKGQLNAPAYLIYLCAILWTIGYDTIYALQDAKDDAMAGILSTARLFGANVRMGVSLFYLGAMLCAAGAILLVQGSLGSMLGLFGFSYHLVWQTRQLTSAISPQEALRLFRSNRNAGLILFAGLALDDWIIHLIIG